MVKLDRTKTFSVAMRVLLGMAISVFASAGVTPAQTVQASPAPPQTIVKAADLQTDVGVLRTAYEAMHPGLYRYSGKEQMDAAFAALAGQLGHDQTLEQAYLAFSEFAAKVKCGHTYANFFNQPKAVAEELFQGQNRVPFYFDWLGGTMVVTEDFTPKHELRRGTEILEINGTPAAKILARLMTIARADGANDAKRVASLAVSGDSVYETFDVYFPMFFPQPSTQMKFKVREPGASKARLVEVEALTYAQRIAPIKAREEGRKGGSDVQFEFQYLADGSAYLRMPTWALFNSKWDWKAWLNAQLDDLAEKNPAALVIDLRGNEGGNDVGDVVLARLVNGDLRMAALQRLVRYRQAPQELVPYLDTWDPSFKDWGKAAVALEKPWPTAPPVSYFKLTRYDDDANGSVIKAEGKHYGGKVFVLVDANNSSATFQFAQVVQQNRLGVLVGQPTGGNQRGINGGAFFFLRLPKSKIEMDLPLIGTFPAAEKPDAGLTPDILVARTVQDIAAERDAEMAAVRAAMGQAKK